MSSGEPVQIVKFEREGENGRPKPTFFLDEITEIVEKGANPLPTLVISICGVVRSGKSFLSNVFVNYLQYVQEHGNDEGWNESNSLIKGINWARSVQSVTSGLWMWSEPFIITASHGSDTRKVAVLLIDSQGTGDKYHSDSGLDQLVMFLSLQLSSVQLVNVKDILTSTALESLKLCTDFARLQEKRPHKDQNEALFKTVVFTMRDHQQSDDFGEVVGVLEDILEESTSAELKKVVKDIYETFEEKSAFNIPYPGEQVTKATEGTSELEVRGLKEDFRKVLYELMRKVCGINPDSKLSTPWRNGDQFMFNIGRMMARFNSSQLSWSSANLLKEAVLTRASRETKSELDRVLEEGNLLSVESEVKLHEQYVEVKKKVIAFFEKEGRVDKFGNTNCYIYHRQMLESTLDSSYTCLLVNFKTKPESWAKAGKALLIQTATSAAVTLAISTFGGPLLAGVGAKAAVGAVAPGAVAPVIRIINYRIFRIMAQAASSSLK